MGARSVFFCLISGKAAGFLDIRLIPSMYVYCKFIFCPQLLYTCICCDKIGQSDVTKMREKKKDSEQHWDVLILIQKN